LIHDPIVDEVRAIRDEFARQYNYDIDAIFGALQALDASSEREHVSFPPREPAAEQSVTSNGVAQQAAAADGASRRA
jgi:hypothetical protein